MKPRLPPPPPTKEDRLIWLRLNLPLKKPTPKFMLLDLYRPSDRRDADNMLNWMAWRHRNTYGAALLIREILEATA